jgi:hypothetical protein
MEKIIIGETGPNSEGEMLWCVHLASSYYDNDSRMPGNVPVDERLYVLALNKDSAIAKADKEIKSARKKCDKGAKEKISATLVTLEDLFSCRDCSEDGRLGFYSTSKYSRVELSCKEDKKRYRLGVCLIPIE